MGTSNWVCQSLKLSKPKHVASTELKNITTEPIPQALTAFWYISSLSIVSQYTASSGAWIPLETCHISLRFVKSTSTATVCCCQTLFLREKIVGPLSFNSDQLLKFYYFSLHFHQPCRKGVHSELSISIGKQFPWLSYSKTDLEAKFGVLALEDTGSTL